MPAEAIGGLRVGVTPLEMADGYATLASGGIHHEPTAIRRVEFPNGKVEETDPSTGKRVLTEGQAYEVTKLLEGVITQGTGAGYTSWAATPRRARREPQRASSDAWFVGYTPLLLHRRLGRTSTIARTDRLRRPDRGADLAELHGICCRRRLPGIPRTRESCLNSRPQQRPHLLVLLVARSEGEYEEEPEEKEEDEKEGPSKGKGGAQAPPAEGEPTPSPTPTPEPAPTPAPSPPPSTGVAGGVATPR